jgi:hypothetical protein
VIIARKTKGRTPLAMALAVIARIAGAVRGTPEMAAAVLKGWTVEDVKEHWPVGREVIQTSVVGEVDEETTDVDAGIGDDLLVGYRVVVGVDPPAAQDEAVAVDRSRFEELVQERLESHGGSSAAARQWARRRLAREEEAATAEQRRQEEFNNLVDGYMGRGKSRATAEQWAREDMGSEP